jgi:hypothetical protein
MNSRHANGGPKIATKVSNAMAKKPPIERTGFLKESTVTMVHPTPFEQSTVARHRARHRLGDRSPRHRRIPPHPKRNLR